MKIGIVILGTNAYFPLLVRFVKRFMQFYKGDKQIKFYLFTDTDPKEYLPEGIDYKYIHTTNYNWVEGTNLKFTSILQLEDCNSDFIFYFDADTNINQPFTEEWFLGDSVAGQHYADQVEGWMKEVKGFERNPRSKAYIPYDTPLFQIYTYGAFWGGTKQWVMNFCRTMLEWQKADKQWGYEPGTNDESFSNNYFHYNPPSKIVYCKDFAFAISDKGGLPETRDMTTDTTVIREELKRLKDVNINIQYNTVTHD